MTASILLYGILVAILISGAAWAADRACPSYWPRRGIWAAALGASLIVPTTALVIDWNVTASGGPPISATAAQSAVSSREEKFSAGPLIGAPLIAWRPAMALDAPLSVVWATSSGTLLLVYAIAWVRLSRVVRCSHIDHIEGYAISATEHLGPAVFGCWSPRILIPAWVLSSPPPLSHYVLAHEQEHIDAGDSTLWIGALLLVALIPWNLPLWWQLRRLRFAIEADCDARVAKRTRDPRAYASVLLRVAQYQGSMQPEFLLGPSLRSSQLERRIGLLLSDRHSRPSISKVAPFLLTASLCVVGYTQVPQWRMLAPAEPKLPEIFHRIEAAILLNHPELFLPNTASGTAVTVVMRPDGTLERSLVRRPNDGLAQGPTYTGLKRKETSYTGITYVGPTAVPIHFAGRRGPRNIEEPFSILVRPSTSELGLDHVRCMLDTGTGMVWTFSGRRSIALWSDQPENESERAHCFDRQEKL
jgi:beta-lactamase regulating signal transducer with metallopeptidase domain